MHAPGDIPPPVAAPTVQGRVESLDVLRGVAILGILLANIWSFGLASFGSSFGPETWALHTNFWVEGIRVALVTGKMRGLLCLLFGAGMYLQYQKLSAAGKWPGLYARRTLFLSLIGILHIVFLWYGDILLMYSLIAFGAILFARVRPNWLVVLSSLSMAFSILVGWLITVSNLASVSDAPGRLYDRYSPARELLVYGHGTYLEQMQMRVEQAGFILASLPIFMFEMGGLFLFGMWMASQGLFSRPSQRKLATTWLLAVGAVGFILNVAAAWGVAQSQNASYESVIEFGLNAPMAIGIAVLGSILLERCPSGRLAKLLSAPGRMALTCYLMQSAICCTLFYSWGFGLMNKLDYWALYFVVFGVWAANIGFAHLWLRRHTMGPVEWAWRALAYGRRPALIRTVGEP
ncbi:MAG: DUF418 domain-containing protein [Armatimonadetes bacterium]|nr:DUF418 domain-containing protein [Armatimonadota bacterium]